MTRRRLPLAALLLAAGCPLPQSVPSVPPGSVTPPRIVEDVSRPPATVNALTASGTATLYDPGCANPQSFTISTEVADENFTEVVTYRWFVDYDPIDPLRYAPRPESGQIQPLQQEPFTPRPVPLFSITPSSFPPSWGSGLHVLELVVSNGFDPSADQGALPLPYRTPSTGAQTYEVQSHKWVFVPSPGCATAPTPTCPPCP